MRASAISWFIEPTFKLAGTEIEMTVLETRAMGTKSAGLYGRWSWRNGCAVKEEVGENSN
ncbi:MAG TPA: hypothetical protein VF760_07685 [Xanthobacteraceae bacterium]